MPRKAARARPEWKPSPECEAAFARIIDTAHRCAATFTGEKPAADPEKNASQAALILAGMMLWFLCRIDPKDMVALASGPGSFADFAYRPFPPLPKRKRGGLSGPTAG